MEIAVLGIDLGKNSCSVVGLDSTGRVAMRRRMRRDTIIPFCLKLPTCVIAMEACCGAHHMGRALIAQGHAVRLMSPEYVRPACVHTPQKSETLERPLRPPRNDETPTIAASK